MYALPYIWWRVNKKFLLNENSKWIIVLFDDNNWHLLIVIFPLLKEFVADVSKSFFWMDYKIEHLMSWLLVEFILFFETLMKSK